MDDERGENGGYRVSWRLSWAKINLRMKFIIELGRTRVDCWWGERGKGEEGAPHESNRSLVVRETERVEAKMQ